MREIINPWLGTDRRAVRRTSRLCGLTARFPLKTGHSQSGAAIAPYQKYLAIAPYLDLCRCFFLGFLEADFFVAGGVGLAGAATFTSSSFLFITLWK